MAELSKEETMQEALIGWILAGGTCEGLITQLELFVQGLVEFDKFEDGGVREKALDRLEASLYHVQWLAAKVDLAGVPGLPPDVLKKPAAPAPAPQEPIKVLVKLSSFYAEAFEVRASLPAQVSIWNDRDVREGLVPTALLNLPLQPVRVLRESDDEAL